MLSCVRCVVSICVGCVVLCCVVLWFCWFVVWCVDLLVLRAALSDVLCLCCDVLCCVALCLAIVYDGFGVC